MSESEYWEDLWAYLKSNEGLSVVAFAVVLNAVLALFGAAWWWFFAANLAGSALKNILIGIREF